ncbi:hypothetical protein [Streptomyces sp. NPDC048172]|uniref:hypothetical protein n=1 Tax=Streptomyces sp. NPDC048172 TaxID=3365505 RepID=UPI0037139295
MRRLDDDEGTLASAGATAAADFDRDGRSDLVVGRNLQEESGADDAPPARSVRYFRGTARDGLVEDRALSERLSRAAGSQGGDTRAGVDLDGDRHPDVLPPGQGGESDRTYVRGGPGGLRPGTARLTLTGSGTVGTPLLPGHVTGGSARNTVSTVHEGSADRSGHVQVTRLTGTGGTGGAVTMARLQTLDMDSDGMPGRAAAGPRFASRDRFAETLRVLDADHDGHDDALAAAPFTGPKGRYGGVWFLPGTPKGLTTKGARHYSGDDLGVR